MSSPWNQKVLRPFFGKMELTLQSKASAPKVTSEKMTSKWLEMLEVK